MKKLMKKIGQNKFQFFFFVGILSFVLVALVIAATTPSQTDDPVDNPVDTPIVDTDKPVTDTETTITDVEEVFMMPLDENLNYTIIRKYYDKNASQADQEKALIKYGTTFRTSDGTSYSLQDNSSFDVLAVFSGKVVEIKENPLFGNYVVIEHDNDLKSYYYGLSEVCVTVGSSVNQKDKIGVSGTTEIDQEAGNHVYLKIEKAGSKINPETLVGKKISEI